MILIQIILTAWFLMMVLWLFLAHLDYVKNIS
jgi:hypothetical protein